MSLRSRLHAMCCFLLHLFVCYLIGQVPAVYLFTEYWRDDLRGLYMGVFVGYFFLAILLSVMTLRSDFKYYAHKALERVEAA